jgi:hypothetical protein
MLCFKYVPVPNRSKFYTAKSQTYLSELLDRWNTSDDFAMPYYNVILDTMTAGQSILMMSPPPADQLTKLWTSHPDEIYYHLGSQYDLSIGEYVHESVHDPKWIDYKAFLLEWDPSNILFDASLKQLDWIPESKLNVLTPPTVDEDDSWD